MKNHLLPNVKTRFSAFLVDTEVEKTRHLESQLLQHFPGLEVKGSSTALESIQAKIQDACPDIVFIDLQLWKDFRFLPNGIHCHSDFETIILSDSEIRVMESIQNAITGYLLRPVKTESLMQIVQHALHRIQEKEELMQNRRFIKTILQRKIQENSVGIPTIEGYEFLVVNEIVRCEALHKCTRVVTRDRSNIVSAYNLGKFKNLLEPYGFFAPHRSYLINVNHIKRYHREGTVHMIDGACIPVANRLKGTLLDHFSRL
ncbi:MAG: LytTR family transcriptional regulator DNA-binding domain-containing protein [Lewinellaceae bacterium]|nr:LytTR family transcriptional regulator DNA-binding domain-containing protein [Lewinellaceae bacterium]